MKKIIIFLTLCVTTTLAAQNPSRFTNGVSLPNANNIVADSVSYIPTITGNTINTYTNIKDLVRINLPEIFTPTTLLNDYNFIETPQTLAYSPASKQLTISNGNSVVLSGLSKFTDGTDPNDAVYNNGKVGIGTSAPNAQLSITKTSPTGDFLRISDNVSGDGNVLNIKNDGRMFFNNPEQTNIFDKYVFNTYGKNSNLGTKFRIIGYTADNIIRDKFSVGYYGETVINAKGWGETLRINRTDGNGTIGLYSEGKKKGSIEGRNNELYIGTSSSNTSGTNLRIAFPNHEIRIDSDNIRIFTDGESYQKADNYRIDTNTNGKVLEIETDGTTTIKEELTAKFYRSHSDVSTTALTITSSIVDVTSSNLNYTLSNNKLILTGVLEFTASGVAEPITTLPTDIRPNITRYKMVHTNFGTTIIDIAPTGAISIQNVRGTETAFIDLEITLNLNNI